MENREEKKKKKENWREKNPSCDGDGSVRNNSVIVSKRFIFIDNNKLTAVTYENNVRLFFESFVVAVVLCSTSFLGQGKNFHRGLEEIINC